MTNLVEYNSDVGCNSDVGYNSGFEYNSTKSYPKDKYISIFTVKKDDCKYMDDIYDTDDKASLF
jgi:hypothetical protein